MQEKKKGRVFIRYLTFHPGESYFKYIVLPLISKKIIRATIKDYPDPINLRAPGFNKVQKESAYWLTAIRELSLSHGSWQTLLLRLTTTLKVVLLPNLHIRKLKLREGSFLKATCLVNPFPSNPKTLTQQLKIAIPQAFAKCTKCSRHCKPVVHKLLTTGGNCFKYILLKS